MANLLRTLAAVTFLCIAEFHYTQAIKCYDCVGETCSTFTDCASYYDTCAIRSSEYSGYKSVLKLCYSSGVCDALQKSNYGGDSVTYKCCATDLCNSGDASGNPTPNDNSNDEDNDENDGATSGLECYSCTGGKGSTCFDNPSQSETRKCSPGQTRCMSGVASGFVLRSCTEPIPECGESSIISAVHCCNTNNCNTHKGRSPSPGNNSPGSTSTFTYNAALLVFGLLAICATYSKY